VNPAAWKLELERVAPLLKVTVQSDVREWRSRLEAMGNFLTFVGEQFPANQASLERIRGEIRQVLDKLGSREKYLNAQLEHQLTDYRVVQERLLDLNEKHRAEADKVNDSTNELNTLTEDLEAIKDQMHDRGTSMTDTSPIVKIKSAIAQIKSDIQQMEVRIFIMQSNLLTARLGAASG
jgi:estrogen-related receptor beta like 1